MFNLQEINVCVDPLVCQWLIYHPLDIAVHKIEGEYEFSICCMYYILEYYLDHYYVRNVGLSDIYSNVSETPRRTTLIESVHSSSDRDALTHQKLPTIEKEEPVDVKNFFILFFFHILI